MGKHRERMGRLGASGGSLGGLLVRLGAVLGPSWSVLGPSGGRPEAVLGNLGAVLGPSWAVSGPSGGPLGCLGHVFGRLGTVKATWQKH